MSGQKKGAKGALSVIGRAAGEPAWLSALATINQERLKEMAETAGISLDAALNVAVFEAWRAGATSEED